MMCNMVRFQREYLIAVHFYNLAITWSSSLTELSTPKIHEPETNKKNMLILFIDHLVISNVKAEYIYIYIYIYIYSTF